jgi:hypothetical protein
VVEIKSKISNSIILWWLALACSCLITERNMNIKYHYYCIEQRKSSF